MVRRRCLALDGVAAGDPGPASGEAVRGGLAALRKEIRSLRGELKKKRIAGERLLSRLAKLAQGGLALDRILLERLLVEA